MSRGRAPGRTASWTTVVLALLMVAGLVPGQWADGDPAAASPAAERGAAAVVLPTPDAPWDYQIGGAFTPADGVGVVARDRSAAPSPDLYDICYVNAFQTQPDERAFWTGHADRWWLVLRDRAGEPVVDGRWGEFLLDTRTARKRAALMAVVGPWIDGCAADGFEAVELDNLDSWDRSDGLVSRSDNMRFARLLTARAHRAGLAAGQKNWSELSPRGPALGFDFAVAEQCGQWDECGAYAAAYDDRVYIVEYQGAAYRRTCAEWGDRLSVVRRDVDVSPGGVNRRC